MQRKRVLPTGDLALAIGRVLFACVMVAAPYVPSEVVAQTTDGTDTASAYEVIHAFVEAINAGDKPTAVALVAEDACVGYSGSCLDGDRLAGWWDSDIFDVAGRIEDYQLSVVEGSVLLTGSFRSAAWSGAARYVFVVRGGLITGWDLR